MVAGKKNKQKQIIFASDLINMLVEDQFLFEILDTHANIFFTFHVDGQTVFDFRILLQ